METALVILLLIIGAVAGALTTHAWKSDSKPLIDRFRDMERATEPSEHGEAPL